MADQNGNFKPPDLDAPLPDDILELLEKGKTERTVILTGAESDIPNRTLYALTHVESEFKDEQNLRRCISLLMWSDERLRRLPALLQYWEWVRTARLGNTLYFGTRWFDKDFFEQRKLAFQEHGHLSYFQMFGATLDDLKIRHEIVDAAASQS